MKSRNTKLRFAIGAVIILFLITNRSWAHTYIESYGSLYFSNIQSSQPNPFYDSYPNAPTGWIEYPDFFFGKTTDNSEPFAYREYLSMAEPPYAYTENRGLFNLDGARAYFLIDHGLYWFDHSTEPVAEAPFMPGTGVDSVDINPVFYFDVSTYLYKGPNNPEQFIGHDSLTLIMPAFTVTFQQNALGELTDVFPTSNQTRTFRFHGVEYVASLPPFLSGDLTIEKAKTPEPATMLLYGIGFLGAAGYKRIRKRFKK